VSSRSRGTKPSSTSKTSIAKEALKETLIMTSEWSVAAQIFRSEEFNLPKEMNQNFALCFLVLGGELKSQKLEFGLALC
jgi:lysozyme family protein